MDTIAATDFLPLVPAAEAAVASVVVSVHDVAPCTRQITTAIISELSAQGVRVCSILVVPNYHHKGGLTRDREFVTWLRGLQADGHEIVIHGYFHERPGRTEESLRDKVVTRFYTRNEGEFYDLNYDEALASSHGVSSRRHGCWGQRPNTLFAMRIWNIPHACAAYAIFAPTSRFRREHSFIVSIIAGDERLVAVGMQHCSEL
jgi:hypothetical protein